MSVSRVFGFRGGGWDGAAARRSLAGKFAKSQMTAYSSFLTYCVETMREPDFENDGWCLDDGEECNRAAPDTFWIPSLDAREGLLPGDLAKLIFRIHVADPQNPISVERMWVIVRERIPGGYLGILDNDPDALAENDVFWSGIELPFSARHVIDIDDRDENTIALAAQIPKRRWPGD